MHDHSALIKALEAHATDEASLKKLSDLFKVFGDMTRIRILYALSSGEMCVCALSEYLKMDQSAVSHQLKVLKDNRLVNNRREGETVYYALSDSHVHSIITQGYEHVTEQDK